MSRTRRGSDFPLNQCRSDRVYAIVPRLDCPGRSITAYSRFRAIEIVRVLVFRRSSPFARLARDGHRNVE